jgi:nicotinate-nucleotide--dimethylbenzimidazole phosphoribosyltransferase
MSESAATTLAEISEILNSLPGPDEDSAKLAVDREGQLTKPPGALARLEEITEWLCRWQGCHPPRLDRPRVAVFAGNHGVAARGVSAFPAEVTVQMVANFRAGGAAINQLCRTFDAELQVYEMGLEEPTADFTQAPAMGDAECAGAMAYGMLAVQESVDVICLGEMGIANTTSAAALCHAMFGGDAADWTGPGTGVAGDALDNKTRVVAEAVALHRGALGDPLQIMRHLGGRELAAITGAVIAARMGRVPVLLDGYACTAAAAVLHRVDPALIDHCMVAHCSAEPGHIRLLEAIGKKPLLDLGMRLGEASGAALALGLLRASINCHMGMATFAEAGVSDKE